MKIKKIVLFPIFLSSLSNAQIWKKTKLFNNLSIWALPNQVQAAHHEAGHLVIAKILDVQANNIYLKPNNNGGAVNFITNKSNKKIFIFLAGYLTEKILYDKVNTGCHEDINKAVKNIIEEHHLNENNIEEIKKVLQNYIDQTEQLILQNLDLIKFFAAMLLKQPADKDGLKIIYKDQINQIFRQLTQTAQ
ncbi:MAG: hypothetical protein ABIF12_02740 [bacterium]